MIVLILVLLAAVSAGSSSDIKESYKNEFRSSGRTGKHKGRHETGQNRTEFCTDPRTMRKHPAYTEWADAYSCTRHRCQPGGRNLAIYTVGCKRVEAPESAIECEEVVEDTNMQFPFCCVRLRCLVVVRGEVWTRVLGQPWEVLPAAPWSHMYKMKKPPPADSSFSALTNPKSSDQGPVYELSESDTEGGHDKVLRSSKKANDDYNEGQQQPVVRAALPPPDIVIALSTNEAKESQSHHTRRAKHRKSSAQPPESYFEEETEKDKQIEPKNQEVEEVPTSTEKPQEVLEDENANYNYAATEKVQHKSHNTHNPVSWTEIPSNQWDEAKEGAEMENRIDEVNSNHYQAQETQPQETQPHVMSEPKETLHIPLKKDTGDKPSNLQALVDAIGSRMRDIEHVVQKMSDKVHQVKPPAEASNEKRMSAEREAPHKHHKETKRQSAEDENYKRFTAHNDARSSKYLHSMADMSTENPLFIGDTNLTGYFSDASNSVLRRNNPPKEPPQTYMAPVETRRKTSQVHIALPNNSEDTEKKRKKHAHKKRKGKGSRSHKKHARSKDDKRKHFNRFTSGEAEKNAVSLDDSSDVVQ